MAGRSPCLARSRTRGFYLPALGRMTTIKERLRLQGLPTEIEEKCADEVTNHQLGAMIGDAMTVDVLAALLGNLLPACGLLPSPRQGAFSAPCHGLRMATKAEFIQPLGMGCWIAGPGRKKCREMVAQPGFFQG